MQGKISGLMLLDFVGINAPLDLAPPFCADNISAPCSSWLKTRCYDGQKVPDAQYGFHVDNPYMQLGERSCEHHVLQTGQSGESGLWVCSPRPFWDPAENLWNIGMAAHWKLQCPMKRTRFLAEGSQVGICECPIVKDQHGSSGRWQDIFVGAKKRPETKHDWEAQCETRCSVNGTDVLWLAGGWRWFSTFQMGSTGMSKRLGPWGWRMSFMLQLLHVVHHVDVRMVVPYRPWGSRWGYHILCRIIVGSWNRVICPSSPLKTNMHGIDITMVVESTLWLLSFDHYVQHVMRSHDTKLEIVL